ncbi:MAG: VRR-NUC domain-containing protein [Deltaproteobacteria bacterium]|nr:MAG: VRR-NUC domain-containing protein [Deltaproteobacteria bacterium]
MHEIVQLQKRELSKTYYLTNFEKLLRFVLSSYEDLLKPNEIKLIESFFSQNKNAKLLYTRLIGRRGPFFLKNKLNYEEIKIDKALSDLMHSGFLHLYSSANELESDYEPEDYLLSYSRKELEAVLSKKGLKGLSKFKKPELLELFLEDFDLREMLLIEAPLLTLNHSSEFQLFFYLFFGNFHQTLSDFILEDVGALKYERYKIDKETRLFDSRKTVNQSMKFHEAREACYVAMEIGAFDEALDLWKIMGKNKGSISSLSRKFKDYSDQLGRHFERIGDNNQALECYKKSNSSFAKERTIRLLTEIGELEKAIRLFKKMSKSPSNFDEIDFVRKFSKKLSRLTEKEFQISQEWNFIEERWEIKKSSQLNVEEMVVKELKKKKIHALHTENWFWNSLLGLAFWDIIFKPIPGVFHHPFQRGPTDLFHPEDFYNSRKEQIEKRLKSIGTGKYSKQILKTAKAKFKTANYLVAWNYMDFGFLERTLDTFPPTKLEAILRRQLSELRRNSSGLPDVFCIDQSGHPKLYEVKGPGDQLRPNQRAWLSFMSEIGLDCSVLWVKYKS